MIGVNTDKPVAEETSPPGYIVKATFLPGNGQPFCTGSGPFQSRPIAEEADCRMLFDPRVICAEIVEA